jgi:hypothetical protein
MENKIKEFARLLENDQIERLIQQDLACDPNVLNAQVHIRPKKKYVCVDVGTSGKYMIDNITGEIFGIKGYGTPNKSHRHGTLDTIYNYNWGNYSAYELKEKRTVKELLSAETILNKKGIFIDEEGNLYGGIY